MKQTCGECGKEIETGGMGAAPMCEHYKWKHPRAFFGEDIPPKYRHGAGSRRAAAHPDPGEQARLTDYREGTDA